MTIVDTSIGYKGCGSPFMWNRPPWVLLDLYMGARVGIK